jgi:hypothetical protein
MDNAASIYKGLMAHREIESMEFVNTNNTNQYYYTNISLTHTDLQPPVTSIDRKETIGLRTPGIYGFK